MINQPSNDEMIECLERSGYLLEGRLIKLLRDSSYFVEPNLSHKDPRTGISREIDLVAEDYRYDKEHNGLCVKTNLIIEAVNNLYPVVLLNRRHFSPNTLTEEYLRERITPSVEGSEHPFFPQVNAFDFKKVAEWEPYSQYCSFTRKKEKDELMASHPDDLYSSILKCAEYLLDSYYQSEDWMTESRNNKYWRIFMWQPVIAIRGDLFTYDSARGLKKVQTGKLQFNFHFKDKPETLVIDFVTEDGFSDFVRKIDAVDEAMENQMAAIRKGLNLSDSSFE